MKRKFLAGAVFLIAISMLTVSLAGCSGNNVKNTSDLEPVEINQYEGQNLSSVDDFRENSI